VERQDAALACIFGRTATCACRLRCVGWSDDQAGLTGDVRLRISSSVSFRSAVAGFRFSAEVIVVAVRWCLRYGLVP
jgi:hypothetical protein